MAGAFDAGSIFGRLTLDLNEWSASIEKAKADTSSLAGVVASKKEDIEKLGKAFTAVGVAITGALGLCIKSAMDYTLEIGRMSVKTGIATETLSGLQQAADKSGMSLDELGVGMKRFSSLAFDASQGNAAAVETLKRLGVSATDASGKLKPMDQLLMETADKFKAMPNGVEKSALAVDLFGRSGTTMIAMLNRGSDGIRSFTDEAREAGMIITSEGVAKAKAFSYSLKDLDDAFMGVKLAIANALMPVVKTLANAFTFVVIEVRKVLDIFPPLGNTVTIVVGAFGALLAVIGPLLLLMPRLVASWTMWSSMLPVINARLASVGLTMGKLALAAGVLTLAYEVTTWACKLWQESLDRDSAAVIESANKMGAGWRFAQESIKGLTTVSAEQMKQIIASQRSMGQSSEQIGETIWTMFRLKIAAGAKLAAKDIEAVADKIKGVMLALDDKLKAATLDEFNYRRYQAKAYYNDVLARAKGTVDIQKVTDLAKKVLDAELTKIAKEENEKRATDSKAANAKIFDSFKNMLDQMKGLSSSGTNALDEHFKNVGNVAAAVALKIQIAFDATLGNLPKKAKPDLDKVESAFQKSMKKIDVFVQVIGQGFNNFFQMLKSNSDSYYQRQFANLDKLNQKQKDALTKSYNAKIAELDAKDAAEALANQRKEIMMSNMTETEKQAALAAIDIQQKKIEERKKIEDDYAKAQALLEADQAKKRRKLEYEQAVANKKSSIAQAYVNMATAITASFANLGWPAGIFAAIGAGIACMFQINAIKKQPLPELAEGGLATRRTAAIIGEAGPEAILPMRELRRMLGVGVNKGGAGSRTVNVTIQAIDTTNMKRFVNAALIPEIKKAITNERLSISPNAVR